VYRLAAACGFIRIFLRHMVFDKPAKSVTNGCLACFVAKEPWHDPIFHNA
jgi:hypothetical protein